MIEIVAEWFTSWSTDWLLSQVSTAGTFVGTRCISAAGNRIWIKFLQHYFTPLNMCDRLYTCSIFISASIFEKSVAPNHLFIMPRHINMELQKKRGERPSTKTRHCCWKVVKTATFLYVSGLTCLFFTGSFRPQWKRRQQQGEGTFILVPGTQSSEYFGWKCSWRVFFFIIFPLTKLLSSVGLCRCEKRCST